MKAIKKLFSVLLVFTMLLVQLVPTSNVSADELPGKITIKKAVVGEEYSIYKILTLETYDKDNNHYIYRVTPEWKTFIEDETLGGKYLEVNSVSNGNTYVTWKSGANEKEFSEVALAYAQAEATKINPTKGPVEATGTTVEFTNLELGYYLVDSSLGTLCILTTTNPIVEVNEKNTNKPIVEKKVYEESTQTYQKENDTKIGDTVKFQTTITTGAGYVNYVLHDTMSTGLTLRTDEGHAIVVNVDGENVEASADTFTIAYPESGETFTITFNDEYIANLPNKTVILVSYEAILNENAVIEGVGNPNETYLTYGDNGETTHDTTTTYTYAFDLVKTDGENQLDGAKFELYDAQTEGNKIAVVLVGTDEETGVKTYRVAKNGETGVSIEAGKVTIIGLDSYIYYLEETEAPLGYNPLTSRVAIDINGVVNNDDTYERFSTEVVNYTGSLLPSTGGMGTVIFVTVGSILVLAFGVLLVTKLRMSKISA